MTYDVFGGTLNLTQLQLELVEHYSHAWLSVD